MSVSLPVVRWSLFVWALSSMLLLSSSGCNTTAGYVNNEAGRRMYAGGKFAQAQGEFQRALADDPDNPHFAYNLASAMEKQGDVEGAQRLYRHAINIDPRHQPSYHALAKMMVNEGNVDAAQQLVGSWVATQPYAAESHMEMAWIHEKVGNFSQAEEQLEQALAINPRSSLAAAHLGHVYEQTGQMDEAVAMYDRSLMLNPARPSVHNRYASIRRQNWQNMMASSRTDVPVQGPTMTASGPMMPTMSAQAPMMMMPMSANMGSAPAPMAAQADPTFTLASFTGFAPTPKPQSPAVVQPAMFSPAMMAGARPMPAATPNAFQPVVPNNYRPLIAPTADPSIMPTQVFSAKHSQPVSGPSGNSGIIQAGYQTPMASSSRPVVQPF